MRMILIESNSSQTFNLGDEAILSSNLNLLKKYNKYRITVISPLPKVTSTLHKVSISFREGYQKTKYCSSALKNTGREDK